MEAVVSTAAAGRSTLPPPVACVLRGRWIPPPSTVTQSLGCVPVTYLGWGGKARRVVSGLTQQGGRTSGGITVNRFPVEPQSSSLVLANEKLLAGFQRKGAHTRDASASLLLSASQGLYSLRS